MNILIIFFVVLLCILYTRTKHTETFVPDVPYTNQPDYDIIEIPNFLTPEECNQIINMSHNQLFPSKIYSDKADKLSDGDRSSKQCWLNDHDHPLVQKISDTVKQHTNTQTHHQEPLQVVNYTKGGFFQPHYDACEGDETFCERMNGTAGPRYITFLIYLNDNFQGGETVFPEINKTVKPALGKAVIFQNVDKNGIVITQALHGGEPVKTGEKWIANKWIRLGQK